MIRTVKKAAAAVLAALSVFLFTSCGNDTSPVVMELDGVRVTSAMYHYWASSAKGQYIYSYEDVSNTDECWSGELKDGMTVAQYFDAVTLESVKSNLVAMKLFEDYGLKITQAEKKSVETYVSDLITEYADGSEKMMNTVLSEYGINTDILKSIYLDETKSTKVYDYLYGEGGKEALSDGDYEKYYSENYVRFQLIYINNAYQYVTDENGNNVTDDNGIYKTEPLDSAVKAEKDKKVAEVEKKLAEGEDFYTLYDEYSELKNYENGYYYAVNEAYGDEVFYKLTAAAQKAEIGESVKVETESGTCFILKLELVGGAWNDNANSDFFDGFTDTVKEAAYREKLRGYFDKITVDEEAIKEFSVAKVTPAYSF
ncbi:MAG: hypothetical protein PUC29_03490 [Clostridia bacterium]|nr:hypothetical protein [Clostridia bacterium]